MNKLAMVSFEKVVWRAAAIVSAYVVGGMPSLQMARFYGGAP